LKQPYWRIGLTNKHPSYAYREDNEQTDIGEGKVGVQMPSQKWLYRKRYPVPAIEQTTPPQKIGTEIRSSAALGGIPFAVPYGFTIITLDLS